MRTCTTSMPESEDHEENQQRRRRSGCRVVRFLLQVRQHRGAERHHRGQEQRARAENRRHGLHEALALCAAAERDAETTASETAVPTASCSSQFSGASVASDRDERVDREIQRDGRHQHRRRTPAGFRARAATGDVDDDAEQCAQIHKHNAAGLYTSPGELRPLMIDTADALTAFCRQRRCARSTPRARHGIHAREDLPCRAVPGADRRRGDAVCIDPLAVPDLGALVPVLHAPRTS